MCTAAGLSAVGLPPLARGAPGGRACDPHGEGPTPAGAGSTGASLGPSATGWAYPRWRGEHGLPAIDTVGYDGLPPLARGAPRAGDVGCGRGGPTPAGAGSTTGRCPDSAPNWAYPRWRGEHRGGERMAGCGGGLPPLARGAPPAKRPRSSRSRPTPAGAGSTAGRLPCRG